MPRRRGFVHVEHVQDVVVFEEFEEPAKLGRGGVHRGAIERVRVALHFKPRPRFLKQHDREDFLGDASGGLAIGEARDERHCGCEEVEREALVNRGSEGGRDESWACSTPPPASRAARNSSTRTTPPRRSARRACRSSITLGRNVRAAASMSPVSARYCRPALRRMGCRPSSSPASARPRCSISSILSRRAVSESSSSAAVVGRSSGSFDASAIAMAWSTGAVSEKSISASCHQGMSRQASREDRGRGERSSATSRGGRRWPRATGRVCGDRRG